MGANLRNIVDKFNTALYNAIKNGKFEVIKCDDDCHSNGFLWYIKIGGFDFKFSTFYRGNYFSFGDVMVNKLGFLGHIKGFDGTLIEESLKNVADKLKMEELENQKATLLKQLGDIDAKINSHGRTK